MRDFEGEVPATPPTEPSEYPIKTTPIELPDLLLPRWRYEPYNMWRVPGEELDYDVSTETVVEALWSLRRVFDTVLDGLPNALSEQRLLCQLERYGEGAWCEDRWIEDLRVLHPDHQCQAPRRRSLGRRRSR